MTDLQYLSLTELGAAYRRRDLRPTEVTEAQLRRIATLNPVYNAYVTVLEERAMAEARAAEAAFAAGVDHGPLQGVPIGLKDLLDLEGVPTTAGSLFFDQAPAAADATVTHRLRTGGAVILGKQHMHEFAADGPFNKRHGRAYNPWNKDRYTGGSSSGSGIAVAAGLCYAAIGSDTGGSIRLPACYCSTVGLKATYGLVPVTGAVALSWTLDHLGPLTRTVEDAASVLSVIAGPDPADRWSSGQPAGDYLSGLRRGLKGLRIGVPVNYFLDRLFEDVETATRAAIAVLRDLGAQIVEIELPAAGQIKELLFTIQRAEVAAYHAPWFDEHAEAYGPIIRARIEQGRQDRAQDYVLARQQQADIRAGYLAAMRDVDLILTPTEPTPPFDPSRMEDPTLPPRVEWTGPYNITGQPAISVPCGFDRDGLPLGLQLAGRPFDEATVLRGAYAYEQATPWKDRRPPVD